jgi:hypothetical protein
MAKDEALDKKIDALAESTALRNETSALREQVAKLKGMM